MPSDPSSVRPVIKGTKNRIIPQPFETRWNAEDGYTTIERYETLKDEAQVILSGLADLTSGADEIVLRETFGKTQIEVVTEDAETEPGAVNEIWELDSSDVRVPLESHPCWDQGYMPVMLRAIAENRDPDPMEFAGAGENEEAFMQLKRQGTDFFISSVYVLRKNLRTKWTKNITPNYSSVNQVESLDDISPPEQVLGVLPSGEWLKKAPRIRRTGRLWELQQEWHWASAWSKKLYGGTLTP